MTSFQITLTPSRRAAARFVARVRREILKTLAEEKARRGLTQSDIARSIGVHRSVISRELKGYKDLSLGRVGEIAWALGRDPLFALPQPAKARGNNEITKIIDVSPTSETATINSKEYASCDAAA